MNSYRIFKVENFPSLEDGQTVISATNTTIPGFTENAKTQITGVSKNYHGYEFFEIQHEMFIKDTGLAFGFHKGEAIKLEFNEYKKQFTINAYLKRTDKYLLLSNVSDVIKDLYRKIRKSESLHTVIESYKLDLNKMRQISNDYLAAWFRGISSRLSSTGLFGSDLGNEPHFQKLLDEGQIYPV